jgi:hypothetical protein
MDPELSSNHFSWLWFLAWMVVGGGIAFGIVGVASIGLIVLPVALGLGAVIYTRTTSRRCMFGALSGLGLPPLFVALLNDT